MLKLNSIWLEANISVTGGIALGFKQERVVTAWRAVPAINIVTS